MIKKNLPFFVRVYKNGKTNHIRSKVNCKKIEVLKTTERKVEKGKIIQHS